MKIRSVFPEIWSYEPDVEELMLMFLDLDLDADVVQNLISSALSTDKSVMKFSLRSYQHFYAELLADRRTDKCRALHTSLTVVNIYFKQPPYSVFQSCRLTKWLNVGLCTAGLGHEFWWMLMQCLAWTRNNRILDSLDPNPVAWTFSEDAYNTTFCRRSINRDVTSFMDLVE